MIVSRLSFSHYRNLREGEFLPDPCMNVISGRNMQGKTSLLEALQLLTGSRPFRGSRDNELIAFKQDAVRLWIDFFSGERDQGAILTTRSKKHSAAINGVQYGGVMELVGKFWAVVFSPEHLSLVKDGPALHRPSLDGALCQPRPVYVELSFQCNRVLQQRNALLKDTPRHAKLLDILGIWDEKPAQRGARLTMERGEYVRLLSEPARRAYERISGARERFPVCYRTASSEEPQAEEQQCQYLSDLLGRSRGGDLSADSTTVGPHRDNLEIWMDEQQTRSFGLQGQQCPCVLALKPTRAEFPQTLSGEALVVLLDDVMGEPDPGRQDFLLHQPGKKQVFLAYCDPKAAARYSGGGRFEMEQGRLAVRQ